MIDAKTPLGPNVKKLMIERAAQLQVEATKKRYGKAGVGETAALLVETNGEVIRTTMREAFAWTRDALEAVRRSPGSEKWPTDEDVAAEILRGIEARRK